ncbi:MAG TPA: CDP-diacylglycerol--serine O-phosphatidyltransferase [Candidatus Nanoarchaeia archaeon]|nr:CDP-diacylglycerol--serine O-phosphatidyltransferase [Candidatus Nanoarchaeia archaeon]
MNLRIRRERIYYTVTWLRCLLAAIVAVSVFVNRKNIALFFFIFTALLGFFENFISRKHPSQLRAVIDFFADKMLVNFTAIVLAIKGIIPFWVALIFLARDLLTILIGTYLLYKDLRKEFKPTVLGKVSYFFQLMALISPIIAKEIDWVLMTAAISLTIVSGVYSLFKSEFRLIRSKRTSDLDDFRITRLLKLADFFTLASVALGMISIVLAIGNRFNDAAIALLVAVVFDYLDGKVAKSMHQQNSFGKELDSLADTVAFGVAPAIFGFSLMQDASRFSNLQVSFGIIAFTIFLFCGILRLARYNIMDFKGAYQGMPITLNGIIIPIAYFAKVPLGYYPYIFLALGILMISAIKIKKIF